MLQRQFISSLRIFTFNTTIEGITTDNFIGTPRNLFQTRKFSLKYSLNAKNEKEFDDKFEELYEFKFQKQITREEVNKRILQIIRKQPSLNQEIFKGKGLRGNFETLGIIHSKREIFNDVCEEFNVQLPLGDYDSIQNGLDLCTLVCDSFKS